MEYVTYSKESGFNIVEAKSEQEAEGFDTVCLDPVDEFDSVILKRIRYLLEDN